MKTKKCSPSKKIVIFTGGISSGGAEKQSILLAKSLKEKHKILLVSYFGDRELKRYTTFLEKENLEFFQLKGNAFKKTVLFIKLLRKYNPDVIINFLPSNNVIGGFVGKFLKVDRIIGGVRSSRQSFIKYFELLLSHYLFNDTTVFNNHAGFQYFTKKGFRKKKSVVIHNCIFPIPIKKTNIILNNKKDINILIVSRFEVYKDYYTAIETFKFVLDRTSYYSLKLYIVGTGSLENQIRKWIKLFGIENNVTIVINPENIFDYYKKSDIFFQTSHFEGFSNSIMEAMSYSLPIVATNVGDNHILVKESENGFLVDIKNSNLMANRIIELIKSKDLREKMGNKSFEIIQKDYSLETFAKKFIEIIDEKK